MERKYKAFISYRHLPLEMETAKKLHKRIEHYTVPKDLQKNGEKHLGYVFRDQDELPISSSLSSNIELALDNSEYLIVICTPETSKSKWVLREISYFLEHHDRDHVLTVLADGPSELAFPRQLTESVAADGTVTYAEPLAANIAAPTPAERDRLFRTESLRILASLIGCAYDELYRREQRYKIRRILTAAAAVTCVAAGFIGMLLNRNAEIKANYDQALRNQSSYLASESMALLDSGDRLSAIALAIEAMPEDGDRPLVSKAELALGYAVNAYLNPNDATGTTATGILTHSSNVVDFRVSSSGKRLCSLTRDREVYCWDTEAMQKLWSIKPEGAGSESAIAGFCGEDRVIARTGDAVFCFDAESGEQLWKWIPVSPDFDTEWSGVSKAVLAKNDELVVFCSMGTAYSFENTPMVFRVDTVTGETESCTAWPGLAGEDADVSVYLFEAALSGDGTTAAAQYTYKTDGGEEKKGIAAVDTKTGELLCSVTDIPDDTLIPENVLFTDDGRLIYSAIRLSGNEGYSLGSFTAMCYAAMDVCCVDLHTGEARWKTECDYCVPTADCFLMYEAELTDRPIIVVGYSNHVDILDTETGEVLSKTEYSANICSMARVNTAVCCATQDGQRGTVFPGDDTMWYTEKMFTDRVESADLRPGSYWIHSFSSSELIHYGQEKADSSWIPLETLWLDEADARAFYPEDTLVEDDCFAVIDSYKHLLVSDGTTADAMKEVVLDGIEGDYLRSCALMGCEDGKLTVMWNTYDGTGMAEVDISTLKYTIVPWPREGDIPLFVWREKTTNERMAVCVDIGTGEPGSTAELSVCSLNGDLTVKEKHPVMQCKTEDIPNTAKIGGELLFYGEKEELCRLVDLNTFTVRPCPEKLREGIAAAGTSLSRAENFVWGSEDGKRIAFKTDGGVSIIDADGKDIAFVETQTSGICSGTFSPDGELFLTVEIDRTLRRYRTDSGELLSKTELYYSGLYEDSVIAWDFTAGDILAVSVDRYANLISTEDWGTFAYVPWCFGYQSAGDRFLCYELSDTYHFGVFPRHSAESLVDYGREILNGWELSETQKMQYGLA